MRCENEKLHVRVRVHAATRIGTFSFSVGCRGRLLTHPARHKRALLGCCCHPARHKRALLGWCYCLCLTPCEYFAAAWDFLIFCRLPWTLADPPRPPQACPAGLLLSPRPPNGPLPSTALFTAYEKAPGFPCQSLKPALARH